MSDINDGLFITKYMHISTLKKHTACSFKTMITAYQSTRCYNSKYRDKNLHRRVNLKSYTHSWNFVQKEETLRLWNVKKKLTSVLSDMQESRAYCWLSNAQLCESSSLMKQCSSGYRVPSLRPPVLQMRVVLRLRSVWSIGWDDTDGKTEVLKGKNQYQCHSIHQKFHKAW